MNERIKELTEHAGFVLWGDEEWNPGDVVDWSSRYDDELEKFAELIVQECMNTIATSKESRQTAYYYRNLVAKHFGVEE